ncbi:MAG TPA: sigma 54-interacting transcriptional regulator [Pyrinomonadaceae bacterium]
MSTLRGGSRSRIEILYELQQGLVEPPDLQGSDGELAELAPYLKRKYADKKLDLIFAMAAPRVRIMLQKDPGMFGNVPKVFYEFDTEREATNRSLGPNITGVWANVDPNKTLDLALALHPDTRKVVVISGSGTQDNLKMQKAQAEFRKYESRADFSYRIGDTIEELRSELAALGKKSVVIFLTFTRDKTGNRYSGPEALSMIAPVSSAPIYGYSDTLMGLGLTGGNLLDFEATGKRLGAIGLRVLAGERPEEIPQETAPTVITVDWRELQRWGISEQRLPPGTVVKFRQPSFWELYKWSAIGLVAAVIIEALLIAWLLFLRARRRQAEEENLRLAVVAEAEHRRLNEIVSNVPGIVWETIIDPETNQRKTTFISDYVEKTLGYTTEEWLAQPPGFGLRIMPDEHDREIAERETKAVIESGRQGFFPCQWTTKEGRKVWVESYLTPIFNANGTVVGLRGVTLDVDSRKKAEENVRQAQERSRAILRAIPDIMFLQTPEGVFLDYHARNPKDLFVSPEEFLGKNMRDVLPPELAADLAACFQRALETDEPQIMEYKLTLDHVDRWFEARIVRSGEAILTVVRDITERVCAEAALRKRKEDLIEAQRVAKVGSWEWDPATDTVTWSEELYRMMGRDPSLPPPNYESHAALYTPATWELLKAAVDQALRHGTPYELELQAIRADGTLLWTNARGDVLKDETGRVVKLHGTLQDITDRVQAQQAVQESEARFRNMADTAPVMIWVAGTDKLCSYVNHGFLDFTGNRLEEELGNGWTKGIHPDDSERRLETYLYAFDRREPFRMEYRLRRADGSFHWVFDSATPRFSASGEFLGYIGSCVDIDDRKKSEEDLVSALRELVVAHEEVSRLKNQLHEENIYLKEEINLGQHFGEIVGQSDALKYVLFKIEQVAPTEATVLITGETGTGKELVARAIHKASSRRDRPLVKVNCGALSASLIESELFGHEKGAFTGASARKIGRFELADGATIFLDEIGELPSELQVKLLRVIQEGELERLGSSSTLKVDVRIIAATNRNLDHDVKEGRFREDLWYRLNVFPITVPPLRQRREDTPLLIEHFIRLFNKKFGKTITSISPTTLKSLRDYSWPGNVRELANVLERATINSHGSVLKIGEDLEGSAEQLSSPTKTLEEMERDYIIRILEDRSWRIEGRKGAARLLGLNPSTLRTRMARLGIQKPKTLSKSAS